MDAGTLRVRQAEIREEKRADKQVQESEREYIKERREHEFLAMRQKTASGRVLAYLLTNK